MFGRLKTKNRTRQSRLAGRRPARGQAMVETVMLTVLLVAWGGVLTHFFPDSLNGLQIYMDSFYFLFSIPIP